MDKGEEKEEVPPDPPPSEMAQPSIEPPSNSKESAAMGVGVKVGVDGAGAVMDTEAI